MRQTLPATRRGARRNARLSGIELNMGAIVFAEQMRIPVITDLAAFRRWARSESYPEHGWFSHLAGDLWVDLSMERLLHNLIKTGMGTDLTVMVRQEQRGIYIGDRMWLTNLDAELSTEPDGTYVANESLDAGRVTLEEGVQSLEVIGTPDVVLEVVSPISVEKDTLLLPRLYWRAGIPEFWLVDSRAQLPTLEIWRRGRSKYASARSIAGWVKSTVFGKSFRLVRRDLGHGLSEFTLEIK